MKNKSIEGSQFPVQLSKGLKKSIKQRARELNCSQAEIVRISLYKFLKLNNGD